jgi:TetR/AcrR family transcriptional repressor of nem operon
MGRPSDARDRLVASAAELVHRLGYSAVSVADICADAGLQKGSFYHFFKSEHALVLATLQRHAERMSGLFDVHLCEEGDARKQLEGLFAALHEGMARRMKQDGCLLGCPVGNLSQEMADRDPMLRGKLAEIFAAWQERLTVTIERGVRQGSLRVSDPAAAAELLLAMTQGATILAKASCDPAIYLRIAKRAIAAIEDPIPDPPEPAERT